MVCLVGSAIDRAAVSALQASCAFKALVLLGAPLSGKGSSHSLSLNLYHSLVTILSFLPTSSVPGSILLVLLFPFPIAALLL